MLSLEMRLNRSRSGCYILLQLKMLQRSRCDKFNVNSAIIEKNILRTRTLSYHTNGLEMVP